jgi:hypothetical protein
LNRNRHDVLMTWIAAILWLIVIAIESTALLSASNTSRILYPLLHFIFRMGRERFEDRARHRLRYPEHPAFPRLARHAACHGRCEVDAALVDHRGPRHGVGRQLG